jgi:hypothetical protein
MPLSLPIGAAAVDRRSHALESGAADIEGVHQKNPI